MSEETKVYVVNNSGHDFSPAKKFGKLVYLSEGRMNRFQTNQMYRMFSEKMENSTENDYILISGLIQMNVIAAAIQAYKHGRINMLIYSDRDRDYERREIVMPNLVEREDG